MHSWIDMLIGFGLGIFIGAFLGMCLTALVSANHYDDDNFFGGDDDA